MTDIVGRLRGRIPYEEYSWDIAQEAADEIERLTAENTEFDDWITSQRKELGVLRAEIERLRAEADPVQYDMMCLRIEHLEADNDRLRAALLEIEREATAVKPPRYSWFGERARRALENKP